MNTAAENIKLAIQNAFAALPDTAEGALEAIENAGATLRDLEDVKAWAQDNKALEAFYLWEPQAREIARKKAWAEGDKYLTEILQTRNQEEPLDPARIQEGLKRAGEAYAGGGNRISLKPDSWARIVEELKKKPEEYRSNYILKPGKEGEDPLHLTFPSGGLSFIVAPSGHGKTTLLLDLLADAAKDHPENRHWLFSFEEQAETVYVKTFNAYQGRKLSKKNTGALEHYLKTGEDRYFQELTRKGEGAFSFTESLTDFKAAVASGVINIKKGDFMAEDLDLWIREIKKDRPGLILIDYAQLLYLDNPGKTMQRTEELKQICLMLKDAAVDTGLPVILAAQFNRAVTHAQNMHMSNIADAADIERAASKVIGLWNGNKGEMLPKSEQAQAQEFNEAAGIRRSHEGEDDGTMFLKVLKDRNGVSELWATYPFNGNTLNIDRQPVKHGYGTPYTPKKEREENGSEEGPKKQKGRPAV